MLPALGTFGASLAVRMTSIRWWREPLRGGEDAPGHAGPSLPNKHRNLMRLRVALGAAEGVFGAGLDVGDRGAGIDLAGERPLELGVEDVLDLRPRGG